ncbi:MAG: hypothetical protein H6811_08620 [Phycisphaeraceae bacterium]|nr:hypothetical protein [Phycisphaeraceae bacterium]
MRTIPTISAMVGLALAGCSETIHPDVRVVDAVVVDRTEAGVLVEFALEASSPADHQILLRRVHYSLSLQDGRVFEASRYAEVTAPTGRSQVIRLPVVIPADRGSGDVAFRLSGDLWYEPLGPLSRGMDEMEFYHPSTGFSDDGVIHLGP